MITLEEARHLQPGVVLAFSGSHLYTVLSVEPRGAGLYVALKRDDGLETFATEADLAAASFRGKAVLSPEPPAPEPPPAEPSLFTPIEELLDDEPRSKGKKR